MTACAQSVGDSGQEGLAVWQRAPLPSLLYPPPPPWLFLLPQRIALHHENESNRRSFFIANEKQRLSRGCPIFTLSLVKAIRRTDRRRSGAIKTHQRREWTLYQPRTDAVFTKGVHGGIRC